MRKVGEVSLTLRTFFIQNINPFLAVKKRELFVVLGDHDRDDHVTLFLPLKLIIELVENFGRYLFRAVGTNPKGGEDLVA